jgi:predicted HAD superfamily Cof-like phosphohydrolase
MDANEPEDIGRPKSYSDNFLLSRPRPGKWSGSIPAESLSSSSEPQGVIAACGGNQIGDIVEPTGYQRATLGNGELSKFAYKADANPPDVFGDVMLFHILGCPDLIGGKPEVPTPEKAELKIDLIYEEFKELHAALEDGDPAGIADAIVDSVYVLLGLAVACGINFNDVWRAVQAANLSKVNETLGPIQRREDGKILKPPGFQSPDIEKVLDEQEPLKCEPL